METLVPVVAKMLEGMETTPASILFSTRCWRIFLVASGLGGEEAGGHDDGGAASFFIEFENDVLEEELIDGHLVLGLGGDFGNAGEEALFVGLGVELVAPVGEVELEGRIGNDEVERLGTSTVATMEGVWLGDGVALDDVGDGADEVVENKVEPQQPRGFLRDVLGVDGAALFADGVGEVHEQGSGTGGGVVARDVGEVGALGDEDGGHDFGYSVWGVILRVFSAGIAVVILDEVFEEGGVEVEAFREDVLEGEGDELVDEGPWRRGRARWGRRQTR